MMVGGAVNAMRIMTDSDVPPTNSIYLIHVFAEQSAMWSGIRQLEVSDEIMNHFMNDGVFYHIFAQIEPTAYPQREIIVFTLAKHIDSVLML